MPQPPQTRETLIRRLPNAADVEAWDVFLEIYEPLLFRLARSRGMQQADCEDYVQEVLTAVAKGIDGWLVNEGRGSFRAWLFRIAANLAVNFLTRRKYQRLGSGDSQIARQLDELPAHDSDRSALFTEEYRRELFRWAAERVRQQLSESQWMVFWRTSIEGRSIAETARECGVSVGSVYVTRSRVTKRIRDAIRKHEEQTVARADKLRQKYRERMKLKDQIIDLQLQVLESKP